MMKFLKALKVSFDMEKEIQKIILSENESIKIVTDFVCLKIINKNNKLIVTEQEISKDAKNPKER